jgi:hypothetical protein
MQNSEEIEQTRNDVVTPTSLTLWLATVIFALFALSIAVYISPNASNVVAEAAQQEAGIALEQPAADADGPLNLAAAYAKTNPGGAMGGKAAHDARPAAKTSAQRVVEDGNPYP